MTIITATSGGHITGRCDARCYEAKNPKCTCCCGGKNHSKGIIKAMEESRGLRTPLSAPDAASGAELYFNDAIFQEILIY